MISCRQLLAPFSLQTIISTFLPLCHRQKGVNKREYEPKKRTMHNTYLNIRCFENYHTCHSSIRWTLISTSVTDVFKELKKINKLALVRLNLLLIIFIIIVVIIVIVIIVIVITSRRLSMTLSACTSRFLGC